MSSAAPRVVRLETARLELRLLRPDDLDHFFSTFAHAQLNGSTRHPIGFLSASRFVAAPA